MNYLNTNNAISLFKNTICNPIYVDKSIFIDKISKEIEHRNNHICITRPRRFGKTINAQMLAAYYTKGYDTHYLFNHLKISQTHNYNKHINQHNVIYIDLSRRPRKCNSYIEFISWIENKIEDDLHNNFNITIDQTDPLSDLSIKTQESFIFIFDEWDSIFYEDFMNDNIFDDYFGFNEDEVKELCTQNDSLSYDDLKFWYDGYYTSDGRSLFNPRSVSKAITRGICLNYWTETGPMNEIADCIENNVDAVRKDIVNLVAGNPIEVQLDGYSAVELQLNTRDEILSAMVVFGFFSYYDGMLTIPNYELMQKLQSVLSDKVWVV